MSRVVLSTIGSLGDLHPMIAIGLELRRRGHQPVFCTSSYYQKKLESLGFPFAPLRPDIAPGSERMEHLVKEIMDPNKGVDRLLRGFLFPVVEDTYEDLMCAVSGNGRADLLVSAELIYPAPLVAKKIGIKWASSVTAPMSFFSAHDFPILPPFPRLSRIIRGWRLGVKQFMLGLAKRHTRNWTRPIQRLRTKVGLPAGEDPIHQGKHSPDLVLALFSNCLAKVEPDWPPNTVITGFPFYDGELNANSDSAGLTNFLNSGSPPIVFTLGSAAVLDPGTFYQESVNAACLLKRRAVLLLGHNSPPAVLPEGILACGYVRFSEIFGRAAAIVHQGGIGTTGQALRAGRPMLVMPYSFDQPDNAARIVRLGIGRTVSRGEYKAKRVAAELRCLLEEPVYDRAAQAISRQVQTERGASTACDALERLMVATSSVGAPCL